MNAHDELTAGRPMTATVMYWKDEDDVDGQPIGPLVSVDEPGRDADPNVGELGMPFGYDPDWQTDYGWVTLREARACAEQAGIPLVES
jgi:hypothetical protein